MTTKHTYFIYVATMIIGIAASGFHCSAQTIDTAASGVHCAAQKIDLLR